MTENTTTEQKDEAEPISGVGATLRSVAEDLRNGSSQEQVLGKVVDSLADASDALRDKDMSDAIQGADTFARRNPLIFLGATALVGFAATRLVKVASVEEGRQPLTDAPSGKDIA